jgi:hypothetical protein
MLGCSWCSPTCKIEWRGKIRLKKTLTGRNYKNKNNSSGLASLKNSLIGKLFRKQKLMCFSDYGIRKLPKYFLEDAVKLQLSLSFEGEPHSQ